MAKQFFCEKDAPVVKTGSGSVHGYVFDNVVTFKGIPYARAKRFHEPEPYTWEGVLECTTFGYACPVMELPSLDRSIDFARRMEVKAEECQNLNIWTPGCDDKKRPVLVWIHGGAMSFGSSSEDGLCTGEEMAKHGDVVAVSLNHRLNILGFFDLSDYGSEYRNSGNLGIADMVMALKWIRDNILLFGGDPDNVTLFGQSGGGMKVTALMQTAAADGLFHKGVVISGVQSRTMCDCVGSGREMAEFFMKELGISTVKELEDAPLDALMAAGRKMRPALKFRIGNAGEMPFRNHYYTGDPLECGFREETKDIPLLVGSTFGEFNAPASYGYRKHELSEEEMTGMIRAEFGDELADKVIPLFREAYPERPVVDILSMDYMFRYYIKKYVKKRAAMGSLVWEYIFDQDMPMYGGVSPLHGNDLGFFFHTTEKAPGLNEPGVTEKVESEVFNTIIAFARTGRPDNSEIPEWKSSSADETHTLFFREKPVVKTDFDDDLNGELSGALLEKLEEMLFNAVSDRDKQ